MSLWTRFCRWCRREEIPDSAQLAREEAVKAAVRRRCEGFRRLLSANKRALQAMSSMEELLLGQRVFGMEEVRGTSTRATAAVFQMVRELQALSGNAWPTLPTALADITARMEARLAHPVAPPQGPLVMDVQDLRLDHAPLAGGKMASLGDVAAHVGLPVPDGFVVTVAGYERLMTYGGLRDELERRMQAADSEKLDDLLELSSALQRCILAAPLPPELLTAIETSVAALCARHGPDLLLALRSSAVGEDAAGLSFAGQYRSELQVPPTEAVQVWKEIIASKYGLTALTYRRQHGLPDHALPMAVGVLAMVQARAGGVAYSRDPMAGPDSPGQVVINAVQGLPCAVVDGSQTPHCYRYSRSQPPVLEEVLPGAGRPPLEEAQARRLARMALALETWYAAPQDVEWALGEDGQLVVLQSRPMPQRTDQQDTQRGAALAALPQLAQGGIAVSPGLAVGPAVVVRREADMLAFPDGGILVVERALPRWAPLLARAAGLVSENGGVAGHLASVAREYRLPALFSLPNACSLLAGKGQITLDAEGQRILAGEAPLPDGQERGADSPAHPLLAGSPVYQCLEDVARFVTPLHLLDPASPHFAPEHCQSLHDITRFCHEKAAGLLCGGPEELGGRMGKQLKAGAKLQYWVLDMGGGYLGSVSGPVVELSQIASLPMLALWEGLTAVPWAGPPQADAGSFMCAVLESAMNPALENTTASTLAERNFCIIDADYLLLQARYGYHFSTLECRIAAEQHQNFVSFQFKGGAADLGRRSARAVLLAGLLEEHGFRAEARQDALFAVAEGFTASQSLQKVMLLGYLLLHSRQTDILMRDSARVQQLRQEWTERMAALADGWPHVQARLCQRVGAASTVTASQASGDGKATPPQSVSCM